MIKLNHVFSRQEAIRQGKLFDVSRVAAEVGCLVPVAVTRAVYFEFVRVPDGTDELFESERLEFLLLHCGIAITRKSRRTNSVCFEKRNARLETKKLEAVCGFDHDDVPCITIMLPEENLLHR